MARLTKSEIEDRLLKGLEIEWRDASKKKQKVSLKTSKARRLFQFLLASKTRKPTELPADFVAGLAAASSAEDDPATDVEARGQGELGAAWKLHLIQTEGIGGVNTFGGPEFRYEFDGESLLAQGPNGSGKSSLAGAIIWALTGKRPRYQLDMQADAVSPIYALVGEERSEKEIGQWPPLVSLPMEASGLKSIPKASVKLTFMDSEGNSATISRTLDNGRIVEARSPDFDVPAILLETGIVMPARLAGMKFGDSGSPLSEAVQRLTGLDDLISIGLLCEGLCNKGREYLSYRKKDLARLQSDFDSSVTQCRLEMKKVDRRVPDFLPAHTGDQESELAKLGKELTSTSADLIKVIAGDLAENIDLALPASQQSVAVAISAAREDVANGLEALPYWRQLVHITEEIDDNVARRIDGAIVAARQSASEALKMLERSENDDRFRLKAMAASWHAAHDEGEVANCPLCSELLKSTALQKELTDLRVAGEAATRTFEDNVRAILEALSQALPAKLRGTSLSSLKISPRVGLYSALKQSFTENAKYQSVLVAFGKLIAHALETSPAIDMEDVPDERFDDSLSAIFEKISVAQNLLRRRSWFLDVRSDWEDWWQQQVGVGEADEQADAGAEGSLAVSAETLTSHLDRLATATLTAEPYRLGAEALRKAWKSGKEAREIELELAIRQEVADAIEPLKSLGSLCESVVREAILDLSDRMEKILSRTLISEKVKFQEAKYGKKEGVTIRAEVSENILIDATSIANASWLRAVLWAFIFSLREEAVEQLGVDAFPIMVLDDPQTTFDDEHRLRWSQQISSLQSGDGKVQVLLVTHDQNFVELIKVSGVEGRLALLSSAGGDVKHISIYDGALLEKLWQRADTSKTPDDARAYINAARIQVETVLRIMLRGEEADVNAVGTGFVVGDSRAKLEWLNTKKRSPWDQPAVNDLTKALNKDLPAIKYLEMSHHAGSSNLAMAEAIDVHNHLKKALSPALDKVFRAQREHFRLHGGMATLHASATVIPWPDGYNAEVRQIPLRVLGKAAALTNGRNADGRLDVDDYDVSTAKKITLAQHAAYRLVARTLEPIAEKGDILIVKQGAKITANSLVVAATEQKLYARRLEYAANHSDVAVLIAQANNPRAIAAPVIAQKSTFELQKIVGVIYDKQFISPDPNGNEVLSIDGSAALSYLISSSLGLVAIDGTSAEPIALHGQFIIMSAPLDTGASIRPLIGRPVIVEDRSGSRYFKRLQEADHNLIVLESLDTSGEHGPVLLKLQATVLSEENVVSRIWPIAGILFEIPS